MGSFGTLDEAGSTLSNASKGIMKGDIIKSLYWRGFARSFKGQGYRVPSSRHNVGKPQNRKFRFLRLMRQSPKSAELRLQFRTVFPTATKKP
ncbi:MAG: hypothetical protein L6V93_18715 [Clostridiales bacterium]|nr:MAG: hypothetical protein L6V93_18715 [Clostridiales bacterium]